MSFLEKPAYSPLCCGDESTWVCHSPTLHYFYCQKCKDEVDPIKGGKILSSQTQVLSKGNEDESLDEYLKLWTGDYPIPKPFPSSTS